jgi:hypothetical protein
MMLGDMLAAARRSAPGVDRWLDRADPALAASLAATAAAEGVSAAGFVRMAVADFGRYATEEDWATLVSRLRDDAAPGETCLVAMLRWRLAAGDARPAPRPAPARGANR